MSKAFDKVWHEGLIFKLKQNGVDGNLLNLFKDYLTNRKQRVVLNGQESDWGDPFLNGPICVCLCVWVTHGHIQKRSGKNLQFYHFSEILFLAVFMTFCAFKVQTMVILDKIRMQYKKLQVASTILKQVTAR